MSASGNTYTLKLLVDDSSIRKLEERLGKIMSGGNLGESAGAVAGGGENPAKQLGKLGAIAAGIASLVVMVKTIVEKMVSASPALQAMLQLLDVSVMLILRPFGDFIAFLLKPILIMFLQKVVIPFYKILNAPFIKAGETAGNAIAGLLFGSDGDPTQEGINTQYFLQKERSIATTWEQAVDNLASNIVGGAQILKDGWANLESNWIGLNDMIKTAGENLQSNWDGLNAIITTVGGGLYDKIFQAGQTFGIAVFDAGAEFRKWMESWEIPTLEEVWNGFKFFIGALLIPPWMTETWYLFQGFIASLRIPDWVTNAIDGFFDLIKRIGEWLASIPDFLSNLFGINNGNESDKPEPPPLDLNVHIDGFVDSVGQAGEDTKNMILGWFNEWLK